MPELVLASASPRRADLLREAGYTCTVVVPDVDERSEGYSDPIRLAETLARKKAEAVAATHPDAVVLGADTLGVLGGELLHKPQSKEDARLMLMAVQGTTHTIITGYALVSPEGVHVGHSISEVRFRTIPADDLEAYLATDEPYDKAGGYGIQGWAGRYADVVSGSHSNVIGLPIEAVSTVLNSLLTPHAQKHINMTCNV